MFMFCDLVNVLKEHFESITIERHKVTPFCATTFKCSPIIGGIQPLGWLFGFGKG